MDGLLIGTKRVDDVGTITQATQGVPQRKGAITPQKMKPIPR